MRNEKNKNEIKYTNNQINRQKKLKKRKLEVKE